jgi:FKBP-type peptidyl-prolyl cis-trans isomerase FklB
MGVIYVSAQTGTKAPAKKPAKAAVKPKAPVMKNLLDSFSYAAGFNVATNMKAQKISKVNVAIMLKAIDDVFKNIDPVLTPEVANTCLQKQLDLFSAEQSAEEKAKGVAFLENNKKRKEVITLPDGLQYEVIKNGDANGVHPKTVDTVEVNYIAMLVNGTEVDNSYKKGAPAAFPLMGVIKGWTEILQLMKPGDHWKVYVPTELAYDVYGNGKAVPPNAAMAFEMVLESIRPFVETPKTGQ